MSCDVVKSTEGLEMSCDVGEVTEMLENEQSSLLYLRHSSFFNPSFASPASQALHLRHTPMEIWIVMMKIKLVSGHSTVEQATTVSFTEMKEG